MLHPLLAKGATTNSRRMVAILASGDVKADVLASHEVGEEAVACLARGDLDGFVKARHHDLNLRVQSFLARMLND